MTKKELLILALVAATLGLLLLFVNSCVVPGRAAQDLAVGRAMAAPAPKVAPATICPTCGALILPAPPLAPKRPETALAPGLLDLIAPHVPGAGVGIAGLVALLGAAKFGARLTKTKADDQVVETITNAARSVGIPAGTGGPTE